MKHILVNQKDGSQTLINVADATTVKRGTNGDVKLTYAHGFVEVPGVDIDAWEAIKKAFVLFLDLPKKE